MGVGRNRGGKDILSKLVSFETFEDVLVELIRVNYLKCLVDYQLQCCSA